MNDLESAVQMWRGAWEYPVPDEEPRVNLTDAERDLLSLEQCAPPEEDF